MIKIINPLSKLPNTLEVHYWLKDGSHSMDAFVQHKCETELLAIIKQVSFQFNLDIEIETEAFGEGGLRRWFKIIKKDENKSAVITATILITLLTTLIATPIGKISEKLIDKAFEDAELIELQKENLKIDLEKKRLEVEALKNSTSNNIINKRRSNLFEYLQAYSKIQQISIVLYSDTKKPFDGEKFVTREDFTQFIIHSDELPPRQIDDVIIEIVSPVLKKGNYKWRGIYDGQSVSFNMKSQEFKDLVQSGKVEFKNGSSIKCTLEIERKINNEGIEINTAYSILRVDEYFENNKPIETNEGKKHKARKKLEKDQIKLSFNSDKLID